MDDDIRLVDDPLPSGIGEARRRIEVPVPDRKRRWLFVPALVVTGCVVLGLGGWAVSGLVMGAETPTKPSTVVTPTAAPSVVLPGFAVEAAWSASDVDDAAAAGGRVLTVSGDLAVLRDVATGDVLAEADVAGEDVTVVTAHVGESTALAVSSDTQALVWAGDAVVPVVVDLSGGRQLVTRSGAFFVASADFSFAMVTAEGVVPVAPPRPQMIVLGVSGDQVLWAGAPAQVITASTNGAALNEVALAPPSAGAVVTPKRGWLMVANGSLTVIGWTDTDGGEATAAYSTATGEIRRLIPGTGEGLLSPDRSEWVTGGQRVSLENATATVLPEGFIPSEFLGDALYGALSDGSVAILPEAATSPKTVAAPSERPLAVTANVLLTLSDGRLSAHPAS
ncbi:hypothetical protein ACFC14_18555 [Microbacterium sp. NPDC055988]|uniref:hypothetical protein n=1 Tax=Microbacterium sp. NPDC055988 TaxID=3345671 RepID=UPI0035DE0F42